MRNTVILAWLTLVLMASGAVAQTPASNISAGTFGAATGGGNYNFPGNVGVGSLAISQTGSLTSTTVAGQSFYTAHQSGPSYAYPDAMFEAQTDNPDGTQNYYFKGLTNGVNKFTIRADGNVSVGGYGAVSSDRSSGNNYTNLFLGGSIADNYGSYTVQTDGGSNYFAAIRMDNSGGNAGAINFYTAPSVGGSTYTLTSAQLVAYQRMTIVGGNVGIGTASPGALLEVNGSVKLTAGSGASMTFPDGTVQSTAWNGVLSGGDYAESVDVIGDRSRYEPGDVLVIDPERPDKFLKASAPYSQSVAGVYSTKPGLTGRRMTTAKSSDEIPMAMMGIVPTKVSAENGAIKPGDLLVSSSSSGYAMKGTDHERLTGAIVGKAMGRLGEGTGVIEVLVTLQ